MESGYFGKLLLSTLIFAPGIFILALGAFMGIASLLEKYGLFGAAKTQQASANPAPAAIVSSLKSSLEEEAQSRPAHKKLQSGK